MHASSYDRIGLLMRSLTSKAKIHASGEELIHQSFGCLYIATCSARVAISTTFPSHTVYFYICEDHFRCPHMHTHRD